MKRLVFIIIIIAAIIIYQRGNIMNSITNSNKPHTSTVTLQGEVSGNLSILGQSAYKLVNIQDTSKVYYVIGHNKAPAIGKTLSVSVRKHELVILNNDTLAVYMETSDK